MDIHQLLDLLDKKSLTPEENKRFQELLSGNPELKYVAGIYSKVKTVATEGSHLDSQILGEYVLYKNNRSEKTETLEFLVPKIEKHLHECERCKNNFATFMEEFASVDNFLEHRINSSGKSGKHTPILIKLKQNKVIQKTTYSIAALILLYFSVYSVMNLVTPSYKKDFIVFNDTQKFTSRGRITTEFQKGIAEIDNNNYDEAIKSLKKDIKDHPDDKTIFYTYFILGKTYLEASKKNILGIYNDYDAEKISAAIEAFKKSIEKNTGPDFQHLNLDSYYYIARGLLLLNKKDEAKKYLETVISQKGSFKQKAEELLKVLEN